MPLLQPKPAHLGLILPLCASSATMGLALFQYPVFLSFLQAQPSIAGKPLSSFWEPYVKLGGSVITGLGLATTISGIVSWRWLTNHNTLETTEVGRWYRYGALFAFMHVAFVPLIAARIKPTREATGSEAEIEKTNRTEMQTLLLYHTVRTFLVDLPALWCFGEGAALSFWVI